MTVTFLLLAFNVLLSLSHSVRSIYSWRYKVGMVLDRVIDFCMPFSKRDIFITYEESAVDVVDDLLEGFDATFAVSLVYY